MEVSPFVLKYFKKKDVKFRFPFLKSNYRSESLRSLSSGIPRQCQLFTLYPFFLTSLGECGRNKLHPGDYSSETDGISQPYISQNISIHLHSEISL